MNPIDPITVEVIANALVSASLEMGTALQRTAYSTIIREEKDCSAALFDADGNLVAQAEFIPIHLGSMEFGLKRILAEYRDRLRPGDMYASNDPYQGAQHTPDMMMFLPVFDRDELVAFVGNLAHHVDVGGAVPGSVSGNNTERFQEGLVIPPLKVCDADGLAEWFVKLVAVNVRAPDKTLGDLRAQVAANRTGERRLAELIARYGAQTLCGCMAAIVDHSERQMRAAIGRIPDGVYTAEEFMDGGGLSPDPVRLAVAVEVRGDTISVDFTGTAPQVKGAVNSALPSTQAAVYYVVKCVTDPTIPQNHGCFRPVRVFAPPGTVVNPTPPTACGGRMQPCYRIVDVMLRALAPAVPDRVVAGSHGNTVLSLGGRDPAGKPWVFFEVIAGGLGARPNKDGIGGVDVHLSNCMNTPIEATELEFPLRFERYELEPDSGGAGRTRGGQGVRRELRFLGDDATLMVRSDKVSFGASGLLGGGKGLPGRFVINPGRADERVLWSKTTTTLSHGDLLSLRTPGGGGYGDAAERPAELAERDRREGRTT